jgi:hypothetical protein
VKRIILSSNPPNYLLLQLSSLLLLPKKAQPERLLLHTSNVYLPTGCDDKLVYALHTKHRRSNFSKVSKVCLELVSYYGLLVQGRNDLRSMLSLPYKIVPEM